MEYNTEKVYQMWISEDGIGSRLRDHNYFISSEEREKTLQWIKEFIEDIKNSKHCDYNSFMLFHQISNSVTLDIREDKTLLEFYKEIERMIYN